MFTLNDDKSIYATRGDIVFFSVTAEDDGKPYKFQAGDVVRIKVYGKKDAENVVLQKDFAVTDITEKVEIFLTKEDTKIGEVISKPTDYWYEVVLNDDTDPQTIIGYDEDGAKVFKLFPEGDDVPEWTPAPEDVRIIDDELDMTSVRPVQNQAIARAFANLEEGYERTHAAVAERFVTPQMFGAIGDGEADDTEAIQTAIDSGYDVFFPAGTYYTSSSITIAESKRIFGVGDKSVLKSSADVALITTTKGIVVEHLRFEGENTAIYAHQTNNTIRDISIDGFAVGIKNKNIDYIASVRIERVYFDNTNICFSCDTLCNGVTFDKCVAYRFDAFISAGFMEGVSINDCFLERGNDGSAVIRKHEDYDVLRCYGVSFNGCYIEHVTDLISADVLTGVVNLSGCWLFHKDGGTVYDGSDASGNCKFSLSGNTFGMTSGATKNDVLMRFSDEQTVIWGANQAMINNSGMFDPNKTNIVGTNVFFVESGLTEKNALELIHKFTIKATTSESGIIEFPSIGKHVIGCHGWLTGNSGHVNVNYTSTSDKWVCLVTNLSGGTAVASKEAVIVVTYVATSEIVTDDAE
jgi:hypothetical protein